MSDYDPFPNNDLRSLLSRITPSLSWKLINTTRLHYPVHHPRGLIVTDKFFYVAATEIKEEPQPLLQPLTYVDGSRRAADGRLRPPKPPLDRSPGKGVPHLFVISKDGSLVNDVPLTPRPELVSKEAADCYHAGGIDLCQTTQTIYIPVAQNRPNSHTVIISFKLDSYPTVDMCRVCTEVDDFIGAVAVESTSRLWGIPWDGRKFISIKQDRGLNWKLPWQTGIDAIPNPSCVFALRHMQTLNDPGLILAAGVKKLPGQYQTTQGNQSAGYCEVGGIMVMDTRHFLMHHESPVDLWLKDGRAMTRNAVWFEVIKRTSRPSDRQCKCPGCTDTRCVRSRKSCEGKEEHWLRMWALPNDGSEAEGTPAEIYELMARIR